MRPLLSRPFRPSSRRIADFLFPRTDADSLRPKLNDCLAMSSVRFLSQSSVLGLDDLTKSGRNFYRPPA